MRFNVFYLGGSFAVKFLVSFAGFIYPPLFHSVLIYILIEYIFFSAFWFWTFTKTLITLRYKLFWQCCFFLLICSCILAAITLDFLLVAAWPLLTTTLITLCWTCRHWHQLPGLQVHENKLDPAILKERTCM